MRPSPLRAFGLLAGEALGDALRRRVVIAVAVLVALAMPILDRCTGAVTFIRNGQVIPLESGAGLLGPALFAWLALGVMVLAGLLAADELVRPLDDGSAAGWLARPVPRDVYALARLSGAAGVALAAGAVLLGATAFLLYTRSGLGPAPAVLGALACAGGVVVTAALAMLASLFLPRAAVLLLVLGGIAYVAVANGLSAAGAELGGLTGWIDRAGPPLGSALYHAVALWSPQVEPRGSGPALALRLALWTAASAALLLAAFRRTDLARGAD